MTQPRTGSAMSDKQIARQAVARRRVTFYPAMGPSQINGYVVGQDNFHWLVAAELFNEYVTVLVHKTAPVVVLSNHSLSNEDEHLQNLVSQVGTGFFLFCEKNYLGKTDPATQEQAS